MALKLLEAVAPLWIDGSLSDHEGDTRTDSEDSVIDQLAEVFDKALEMQFRLMLTGRRYECIWYAPGTSYDQNVMTPHNLEGVVDSELPIIRQTLLPGIHQIVDCKTGVDFGGFTDSQTWPKAPVVCLVQALVWRGSVEVQ